MPTTALRTALRRASVAGLATVVAASGLALVAPSAVAAEIYPVPSSGVFEVDGRGFGHGRGMSQYGMQGAALQGVSSATILSAYYRGTASTAWPSGAPVRVVLTREGREGRLPGGSASTDRRYECDSSGARFCELEVLVQPGLWARSRSGTDTALPESVEGARVESWRVRNDPEGLVLEAWAGLRWRAYPLGGIYVHATQVELWRPSASVLRVQYEDGSNRQYRGSLAAVRTSPTTMARINHVPREEYLRAVVPREAITSWRPAALEAQAVAARSYAENYRRSRPAGSVWDICDSTYCQVYAGMTITDRGTTTSVEVASTDAAIRSTAHLVRTSGGEPIRAEFSSSNGGWTVAGGQSWLPAQQDGWDGLGNNPHHRWSGRLPVSALQSAFPAVGRLTAVVVHRRDGNGEWGGRVLDVELRGTAANGATTSVRTTGDGIRNAYAYGSGRSDGIRSSWWSLRLPPQTDLTGAWAAPGGAVELAWRRPDGSVAVGRWAGGSAVSATTSLGGASRGGPAVAGRTSGWREVFAWGTDDQLWTNRRAPGSSSWTGWQPLGGKLAGRPAAAAYGDGMHVVVVGPDRQLWHRHSPRPGVWSGWYALGGTAANGTGPAVAQVSAGRLDVVVQGTDNRAWRRSYDGGWKAWQPLGGGLAGGVGAASPGGELVVTGRGPDLAGWTRTDSASWSTLGGQLLGAPAAAAALGGGRVDAFAVGLDGAFYVTSRTTGPWSGWRRLS